MGQGIKFGFILEAYELTNYLVPSYHLGPEREKITRIWQVGTLAIAGIEPWQLAKQMCALSSSHCLFETKN